MHMQTAFFQLMPNDGNSHRAQKQASVSAALRDTVCKPREILPERQTCAGNYDTLKIHMTHKRSMKCIGSKRTFASDIKALGEK